MRVIRKAGPGYPPLPPQTHTQTCIVLLCARLRVTKLELVVDVILPIYFIIVLNI